MYTQVSSLTRSRIIELN